MVKGIYVALSGAVAEGKALENVAHNVANAGTTGFRAQKMTFAEVMTTAKQDVTPPVAVSSSTAEDKQGAIKTTGNKLDLAISGEGMFAVEGDRGVRYTRAGDFGLDGEGQLVNHNGEAVLDDTGAHIMIPLDATDVSVGRDGSVRSGQETIAKIARVTFNAGDLTAEGVSFAPVAGAKAVPVAEGQGEIVSGSLERSSFDAVRGMVELVRVSRSYETLTRMIEGYKQMDERASRAIGEK